MKNIILKSYPRVSRLSSLIFEQTKKKKTIKIIAEKERKALRPIRFYRI